VYKQYPVVTSEALAVLLEHRSGPLVDRLSLEVLQLTDLGLVEWADDCGGSRLTTRGVLLCSNLEDEANRLIHTILKPAQEVIPEIVSPEDCHGRLWWILDAPGLRSKRLRFKYHYVAKGEKKTACGVRLPTGFRRYLGRGHTPGRIQMDKCPDCVESSRQQRWKT
jgi:hypothetical protein